MASLSAGQLLTTVREHLLTVDLRTKQTDEKLQQISLELSQSRMKYLKEKTLNHFLQNQSLEDTFLRDLLSLKDVSDQSQVLGIDERYIQSQRALYKLSMKDHKPLVLEKIKQSVEEICRKLLQWINNSSDFNKFDKEQFKRVPVIVRGKSTATKLKRDEMRQLKKEISERNVELHKLISDNCRQLLSFLSNYQLQYVAQETSTSLDHLSCKTDALRLKLNVVRLQLMVGTYSPDTTQALSEIKLHLDEYKQQLEVKLVETEQTLLHYESLGPNFMAIAKEYHELIEEIDNKKWAMRELQKPQTR